MKRALPLALLLLTAGAGGGAAAQDEGRSPDPPVAEELAWMVGAWEGARHDGEAGDDDPGAPLDLRFERILGGAGYAEHLEITHDGGVYRGFAAVVFDPEAGTWVRQYVNAARGRFVRLEGTVEGGVSTWRSAPGDGAPPERLSKQVSERLDGDRWRRTLYRSDDGGETWRVLWRDELARVAPP